MKIRLFDRFDTSFTVAVREDVKAVYNNTIYYEDGEEETFSPEFEDWEEIS